MFSLQQVCAECDDDRAAGSSLAVPVLFHQLGHELLNLRAMVSRMEASIDGIIENHAGTLDAESIRNLQLLDIVGQTLNALAVCCGSASTLASADWIVDGKTVTEGLTLANLASRLARGIAGGDDTDQQASSAYKMFSDG